MFNTLIAEVDGTLVAGVVPVEGQLDLKALAAASGGKKAAMAQVTAAERATGYLAGGISPVGPRKRLSVVLDASAMSFATVFCSGGRRRLEIELVPPTWSGPRTRASPSSVARDRRCPGAVRRDGPAQTPRTGDQRRGNGAGTYMVTYRTRRAGISSLPQLGNGAAGRVEVRSG